MDRRTILLLEINFKVLHVPLSVDLFQKFIPVLDIPVQFRYGARCQQVLFIPIPKEFNSSLIHVQKSALEIRGVDHVVTAFKNAAILFLSSCNLLLKGLQFGDILEYLNAPCDFS